MLGWLATVRDGARRVFLWACLEKRLDRRGIGNGQNSRIGPWVQVSQVNKDGSPFAFRLSGGSRDGGEKAFPRVAITVLTGGGGWQRPAL
jgi:hypothetical protein